MNGRASRTASLPSVEADVRDRRSDRPLGTLIAHLLPESFRGYSMLEHAVIGPQPTSSLSTLPNRSASRADVRTKAQYSRLPYVRKADEAVIRASTYLVQEPRGVTLWDE